MKSTKHRSVLETMPRRREDVVRQDLEGGAVLFDPTMGTVHHFNDSTLLIWDLCDGRHTASETARYISRDYSIQLHDAKNAVDTALKRLDMFALFANDDDADPLPSSKRISRRQLLRGGTTKLIFTAPVVSTFFATGAYASGPSATAAFGAGGCKTVGYSCAASTECCLDNPDGNCVSDRCCILPNKSGCNTDDDCCNAGDTCTEGTCL